MKIQLILASTRQGRVTERVTKWAAAGLEQVEGAEIETLDLANYPLPLMEEAISPRYNPDRQPAPEVAAWTAKIAEADGYVIVAPEYNASMPAVLKTALDALAHELDRKPVALVTHGVVGGAQAAESIRTAVRRLGAVNVPEAVTMIGAGQILSEDGQLSEEAAANPYGPAGALTALGESLAWWTKTLKAGRDQA